MTIFKCPDCGWRYDDLDFEEEKDCYSIRQVGCCMECNEYEIKKEQYAKNIRKNKEIK